MRMSVPPASLDRADGLTLGDLRDVWGALSGAERARGFQLLPRPEAEDLFLGLPGADMAALVLALPADERRSWLRLAPQWPPDGAGIPRHLHRACTGRRPRPDTSYRRRGRTWYPYRSGTWVRIPPSGCRRTGACGATRASGSPRP